MRSENYKFKEFVESDKTISNIVKKVGKEYVADGLTNEEDVLLAIYITNLISDPYDDSEKLKDIKDVYFRIGGDVSQFTVTLKIAQKNGLIGLKYMGGDEYLPYLSSLYGYMELQKILGKQSEDTRIIVAGHNFSGKMNFRDFLKEQMNYPELKLVDPYISSETLYHFTGISPVLKKLTIITNKVSNLGDFKKSKDEFTKETGVTVDIRKNEKLHDRYLISDNDSWSLGGSIKDIGNKDTIITRISQATTALNELFEIRWNEGENVMDDK